MDTWPLFNRQACATGQSPHKGGKAVRLRFNNFEITFYNVAAIPTLPTIAWGTLRHSIEPELYALATIVNLLCSRCCSSSSC